MRSQRVLLVLLVLSLLAALSGACDSGKTYPTAPAPPTLKVKPPEPRRPARQSDDDEDLDDDEDFDDEASDTRRDRSTPSGSAGAARTSRPGLRRAGPKTINGHPEGPRAEVFNAVVNNAMRQASTCFAKEPAGQTLSFRVKMTVGNSGTVKEATVVSGPDKPKVRACLTQVVRALVFPPFKGPQVSQVIPFTAIRQ